MKQRKKFIFILILTLGVVGYILITRMSKEPVGLRVCPDEMVILSLAGADRSGVVPDTFVPETEDQSADQSYYVLDGEQKAIQDFDTAWVAEQCRVPITNQD